MMNEDDFLTFHKDFLCEAHDICVKKNKDYSGFSGDPFANFRQVENLGISPEIGIMVRMSDKFSRIKTFLDKGELQNEGVKDACLDIVNYVSILYAMIEEREN